ncbi:TrbI/VirB10 family protein [Sphingobium boeckii]|uniref:Type IV secretion system protein VirB10 n=1 Tax=Sphingobium boeckii TaxID=1082345 RepID=A0A7W9AGC0_9SPHN|nr:TrbI/VirB10 family protein [Sphingobium boeckii]MBB5684986.1 type IV secretion system protein VirB10 [Sphingobium boeckii]
MTQAPLSGANSAPIAPAALPGPAAPSDAPPQSNAPPKPVTQTDHPVASPPAAPVTKPAAKVDPETLTLRAHPVRAIRFKRSVIIGLASAASVALVGTAWLAFKRPSLPQISQARDTGEMAKPSTEALNALPASYGDVPKLGPPLPGDLGRTILAHQRAMADEAPAMPHDDGLTRAALDQAIAERKSARESGLMANTVRGTAVAPAMLQSEGPDPNAAARTVSLDPEKDPNAQMRKADFVSTRDGQGDVNPHEVAPAPSPFTLSAGSVIAGSLISGLRSDLPGLVTAQVTERVFDSATGRILLIPQGARLIGSYDSVVAFGQKRALVVWQRIIFPNGSSLRIENVPASDASGYAGLADKVDFHSWALLKGVALSTLLGVGANLTFAGESDLVQAIRESTQQNASRAGDQITSKNLQIQPTITIRPGASVRLVVHRDLILSPWKE